MRQTTLKGHARYDGPARCCTPTREPKTLRHLLSLDRNAYGIALGLALLGWTLVGCNGQPPRQAKALSQDSAQPKTIVVNVEIVDDRFEITRGLMCREQMRDDWGMLFFMEQTRVQSFWMKNTLIPLDMVFIGEDWRVVGSYENATPETTSPRGISMPSRYVLELTAGSVKRLGIMPGMYTRFTPPTGRGESGQNTENPQCRRDQDCTNMWSPSSASCGTVQRCFEGRCIEPPAITGRTNGETAQLAFPGR